MSASTLSRRTLLALSVVGAALSLPALAAEPQALVVAKSEITFVAKQLGVPLDGRFKTFSAQTAFDPKAPQTSKIAFTVDLGSVALNPDADTELAKPEWFNIGKFPKASFQSTAIKALGAGRFEVAGKLVIKGNARDLVVPVQLAQAGGLSTATGSFGLKRLDFKVGEGDWADTSVVANDVQVKFKLVLQGVPAQ
jgi:polyisoprenoid-binding protein YceI